MAKLKDKKCKICKNVFSPFLPLQQVCSPSCAYKYSNKQKDKEWKQKKKTWSDELKTHSDWCNDIQPIINSIARAIDKGSVCISSLKPLNDKFDAGHRFSVGAFPELRFNLLNIHAQSVNQNQYLSGNPDGYDFGLSCVYGDEYLKEVHDLRTKYKSLKLTIPELIKLKARAKKALLRLKKEDLIYSPEERIQLRKSINIELGVYC